MIARTVFITFLLAVLTLGFSQLTAKAYTHSLVCPTYNCSMLLCSQSSTYIGTCCKDSVQYHVRSVDSCFVDACYE